MKIFSSTLSTIINQPREIYNSTGAVGAARAAGLNKDGLDLLGKSMNDFDKITEVEPNTHSQVYQHAYLKWKTELEEQLKKVE